MATTASEAVAARTEAVAARIHGELRQWLRALRDREQGCEKEQSDGVQPAQRSARPLLLPHSTSERRGLAPDDSELQGHTWQALVVPVAAESPRRIDIDKRRRQRGESAAKQT